MPTQPLRVLTILARHGTEQYPQAAEQIEAWFRRHLPDAKTTLVVVDNALPPITTAAQSDSTLIGGDNSAREFSAFDRGMAFVGERVWSFDLIHFATSAFNTLYTAYLDRFDDRLLRIAVGRPVSIGHIDCYNEPVEILGCQTQHWIRTCFFFMPPTEARAIGSFVSLRDHSRFFSGDPRGPFRAGAPLSARYQQYILEWLTGRDIGQGVTWHSAFGVTGESLPGFEQKALSIMNEQLFGVRLRAQGCNLIDVTWLATLIKADRLPTEWWNTPWREQLAARGHDRIVVAGSALASP